MEVDVLNKVWYCSNRMEAYQNFKFESLLQNESGFAEDDRQMLKNLIKGFSNSLQWKIFVGSKEYTKEDFEADKAKGIESEIEERERQYQEMRDKASSYLEFHQWLKDNGYTYNKDVVDGKDSSF